MKEFVVQERITNRLEEIQDDTGFRASRIRQGKDLYHVNLVVDTNNLIFIQCACSLGSYDLDHIHEDGIFGSPMYDLHRAMIFLDSHHIVTILYCFSNQMDLDSELEKAKSSFSELAVAKNMKTWILNR